MLAAFITSHVHCSKQARSCLHSPALQAEKFLSHPPLPFFSGGVVLATALSIVFLRWHLHYMLFAFVHEAIVKRLGLMTVSILDGRSVPFDAPGPRSGGRHADPYMFQVLSCC